MLVFLWKASNPSLRSCSVATLKSPTLQIRVQSRAFYLELVIILCRRLIRRPVFHWPTNTGSRFVCEIFATYKLAFNILQHTSIALFKSASMPCQTYSPKSLRHHHGWACFCVVCRSGIIMRSRTVDWSPTEFHILKTSSIFLSECPADIKHIPENAS